MIPILFPKDAIQFNTLGLHRLPDAESCIVTEERNGEFELELVYPVDGLHYKDIEDDMIIVARPSDGGSKQAFRIYRHGLPLMGDAYLMRDIFRMNSTSSLYQHARMRLLAHRQ